MPSDDEKLESIAGFPIAMVITTLAALVKAGEGGIRASDIAPMLGGPSSNSVSRLMIGFVERGWVSRERRSKSYIYFVTPIGQKVLSHWGEMNQTPDDRLREINDALYGMKFHGSQLARLASTLTEFRVSVPLPVMERLVVLALKGMAR